MRAVLTYHSIDETGSPISVSPSQFAAHVRFLASDAVDVVPLEALVNEPDRGRPTVALTFDDAFANFEAEALSLLDDHDLPATVFVVTGAVGGTNAWGGKDEPGIPTLPLLGWDGLGRVQERGVVLGAHSHTHPHLSRLSGERLIDELTRPAAELESHTGIRPDIVAYPYGDHDATTTKLAADTYRLGCTTELYALEPGADPLAIPRLEMLYLRGTGRLESFGSAGFNAYLGFRRALRRIRSLVLRP